MKSPFPGMDPFIEGCGLWGDFHHSFVCTISRYLCGTLPDDFVARLGTREYFDLVEYRGVHVEGEFREPFVKIIELANGRVLTRIEVLSPVNKRLNSEGRKLYLTDRDELLNSSDVNFVEIDLLRAGQAMPMGDFQLPTPYTVLVSRKAQRPKCQVWPCDSLQCLPVIPIPFSDLHSDVVLDMQPMIVSIYRDGRYHQSIDYQKSLTPPLRPEELSWLLEHRLPSE